MNNIQKTLDFLFKYRKLNTVFHVIKKTHINSKWVNNFDGKME